jgi:tetratricopeptide (TPR) repeat protein
MLDGESSGSGTRLYMAPELLEGREPSPQADLYALGVMLYQLVVGDLGHAMAVGWERDVTDEVLRDDIAALVQGRPEERLADAGELARRLRSLEERRQRRVAEAQEREALERALRRRKVMRVALGFVTILAVVMGVQGWRIAQEADRANREAETASEVSRFLVDVFDVAEEEGETVTARELLERGSERIRTELADQPLLQARLLESMGRAYMNLGLYAQASPLLKQALTVRRAELGNDHLDTAASLDSVGVLYTRQGRYAAAETELRRALEVRESVLGPSDPLVVDSLEHLVQLYHDQGRYADAQPVERRLAEARGQTRDTGPAVTDQVAFEVGTELVREVEIPAGTTWVLEGPREGLVLAGSKEWAAVVDLSGAREPAQIPLPEGQQRVLPGGRVVVRDGDRLIYRHLFYSEGPLAEQVVLEDVQAEERVALGSEGRRVVRIGEQQTLVYEVGVQRTELVLEIETPEGLFDAGLMVPSMRYLAWIGEGRAAQVVSLKTGEAVGAFQDWEAGVRVLHVDDVTRTLIVGGWFDEVYMYDLQQPETPPVVASSPGEATDVHVLPDYPTVAIAKKSRVVLWRDGEGIVWEYREPSLDAVFVSSGGDGLLAFDRESARVLGFSYRAIPVRQRVKLSPAPIWAIASDGRGERIWFGSADGFMHEFEPADATFSSWEAHTQGVTSALYRDGKLVSASDDRTIAVWDAASRERLMQSEAHGYLVNFLYWDGASDWIWSSSSDGKVKAWQWPDLAPGETIDTGRLAKAGFWLDAEAGLALIGTWGGSWLEVERSEEGWKVLEEHVMPGRGVRSGVYTTVELEDEQLVLLLGIHPARVYLYDLASRQAWLLEAPELDIGWATASGPRTVLLGGTTCVLEYRFERRETAIRYAVRVGLATELGLQGVCEYNSALGRLVAGTAFGSVVVTDPEDLPEEPIITGRLELESSS